MSALRSAVMLVVGAEERDGGVACVVDHAIRQAEAECVLVELDHCRQVFCRHDHMLQPARKMVLGRLTGDRRGQAENRSEECTTELQSIMRNSYDVLCLKQKKTVIH